ncbi:MAG: efflux RND transporter periplasmic adaptor subunit [Candidatus Xenobia bacterium]
MSSLKKALVPVALLLWLAGCTSRPVSVVPSPTHTMVVVETPTPDTWSGLAVVPPAQMAVLTASTPAPVQRVFVSVGQTVKRGAVLITLSNPQAQAAFRQARANVAAAKAELKAAEGQARIGLTGLRRQVVAARQQVQDAQHAVRVAQQGVITITATSPPGMAEFEPAPTPSSTPMAYPSPLTTPSPQVTPLAPLPTASPTPVVTAPRSNVQVTRAPANPEALERARERLAVATRRLHDLDTQLTQAQNTVHDSLLPHQQRVQMAIANLAAAQAAARSNELRSPIDGQVLALNAWPGQAASTSPQRPLAQIVDLRAIKLQLSNVPLQVGSTGTVTFAELPGISLPARVDRVETGTGTILIGFDNTSGKVKPGMHGTFTLP